MSGDEWLIVLLVLWIILTEDDVYMCILALIAAPRLSMALVIFYLSHG